jgi:hypothetical protein
MEKYIDEYEKPICNLSNTTCDISCPFWDNCPIEKFDVAQGEFVNEVIKIAKDKK